MGSPVAHGMSPAAPRGREPGILAGSERGQVSSFPASRPSWSECGRRGNLTFGSPPSNQLHTTTRPTPVDFEELLAFLPIFTSRDFHPVKMNHGGRNVDGSMQFIWPEYEPEVERFIQAASKDCWQDRHYSPEAMGVMISNPEQVGRATLEQVRSMLTYCVRGERFCDGHIGHMIESGHVARVLERLSEISDGQGS